MNDFDIIVCGGGTAGSVAAIRAARLGLKVALIERQSQLGGSSTLSLVTPTMANVACNTELVGGIHRELHSILQREGYGEVRGFDPIWAAMMLERMADEHGVRIFYHCEILAVRSKGNKIEALEVAALGKKFDLSASYFIDATGDALVAMMAGETTMEGRDASGYHQPLSLRFMATNVDIARVKQFVAEKAPTGMQCIHSSIITPGTVAKNVELTTLSIHLKWLEEEGAKLEYLKPWKNQLMFSFYTIPGRSDVVCFNAPRVICEDPSDSRKLSLSYIDGRKQIVQYWRFFKENVPGFENSYIDYIAPLIGIRECRRIVGKSILTESDVRDFAHFEDGICLCNCPIDVHHISERGTTLWYLPDNKWYEIPYTTLLPKNTFNLIVAGRCISTDFIAHSSYRIIPICRCLGEAAAYACNMALKHNEALDNISGRELREKLIGDEVIFLPN